MWLTRLAIKRPIVIWMALVAIAILGVIAYSRLPAELNPRVDIPTITVITAYPGAGPAEIEALVTRPLEDAVGTVSNVQGVYSSSQESVSIISADFRVDADVDQAVADVREKVEAARALLPAEARAPVVARLDLNAQPVLYLALSSGASLGTLRQAIDQQIKPRLARIPGVASVNVIGGQQREIRVLASAARLAENKLTIEDVVDAIKAANRDVPGGSISQRHRDLGVRTLASFDKVSDIARAQIFSQQAMAASLMPALQMLGAPPRSGLPDPLTVGDVANVLDTNAKPTTLNRVDGRDSVALVITKASDANTVDVVRAVRAEIDRLKGVLPADTEIAVARDESVVVTDALEDVNMSLALGALLAMMVVFLFLHDLRGTLIVALALPACIVATFLVMFFADFTLNQMTLLALSLTVGILIDDSIVVLESITRHLAAGETPEEAAFNGRTEIGFAGVTLTLTDVVVFLPIAFMGGIIGAFFRQFGLTVVAATLFSLVVSFTVTPCLAARWYRAGEDTEAGRGRIARALAAGYARVEAGYRRLIVWALARRWWVVSAATVALVATVLFTTPSLGFELLPATDQGQVVVTLEMPPDASLASTDAVAREVEHHIAGMADVRNYVTTVGEIVGGFGTIPQQGSQFGQINVRLTDTPDMLGHLLSLGRIGGPVRHRSDEQFAADLRSRLRDVPGARIVVSTVRTVADIGAPIQVQLRGQDLDALASAAAQLRDRMEHMPGVLDPISSLRTGKSEVQFRIDRARAAAFDIPPAQAGAVLRTAVEGDTEAVYREGGTEYPIRVQLAGVDRDSPSALMRVPVGYSRGREVLLGDVADRTIGAGPAAIDRVNGQRMVTISANLAPGYPLGNAEQAIRAQMADINMPGIEAHFGGESEAMAQNVPYFALALGLAVVLVYLVMASLFNSLLNPFIIMFTLPMALVGALAALALTGETLSLVSMIGIIMLTGLMGRNAILLIDYTTTLRARGRERNAAVAEAGATRLRPILMTTLATICGMIPVALRIGRASELRAPMAIVVIGGLLTASLLTLLVIPVLYTLFDDARERFHRGPRWKDTEERGAPEPTHALPRS